MSEITALKPYVLRYWETEFPSLSPSKNPAGNRVYTEKDIHQILEIKQLLYQEKFTIEGARQHLKNIQSKSRPVVRMNSAGGSTASEMVYEKDRTRKALQEIHGALVDLLDMIRKEK